MMSTKSSVTDQMTSDVFHPLSLNGCYLRIITLISSGQNVIHYINPQKKLRQLRVKTAK